MVTGTYWRERAQYFDTVLGGKGVRGVHAGEIGQASWGISSSPAQDVAQFRRVSVNGVPCHQELSSERNRTKECRLNSV